jgi:hypothetical protein
MTPGSRVLTIVACGAGPAAAISTCVTLAQDRGWTVQVIATPAALEFFDARQKVFTFDLRLSSRLGLTFSCAPAVFGLGLRPRFSA